MGLANFIAPLFMPAPREAKSHAGASNLTRGRESAPQPPAVEFRQVSFTFDDRKVIDDLSFSVMNGEILIILSGSGGGKSTILKLILGLLKPDEGRIFVGGEEITNYDEDGLQRVRDRMGMVFQEGGLFDSLSVYDNVAFRLHEHELPEPKVEHEVRQLLRFVGLEEEIDTFPADLSGGMQKRVSIARALVGDPKLVLFDEPTVALDPPTSATICDLIIKLRDLENVASILVTHEMGVVKYLSTSHLVINEQGDVSFEETGGHHSLDNTKMLMLRDGHEIFCGTEDELIESKNPYIHEFISGTELVPGK